MFAARGLLVEPDRPKFKTLETKVPCEKVLSQSDPSYCFFQATKKSLDLFPFWKVG
jgi:hypothetical protein